MRAIAPARRDDRVLPLTRCAAAVLTLAAVAAGVVLYGFPDSTPEVWAWTVEPRMTTLVMGAGYLATAYFFARATLARSWHTVQLGFLGVGPFAGLQIIATVLHWDRFAHRHVAFWLWLGLYGVLVLMPLVWLRNRRTDPARPDPIQVPHPVRTAVGVIGGAQLLAALTAFAAPSLAIAVWPWSLTPLTARVLAGFVAANAITLLALWWEGRYTALTHALLTLAIGIGLIALAVPRATSDFSNSAAVLGFLAALGAALLIIALPVAACARVTRRHSAIHAHDPAVGQS